MKIPNLTIADNIDKSIDFFVFKAVFKCPLTEAKFSITLLFFIYFLEHEY